MITGVQHIIGLSLKINIAMAFHRVNTLGWSNILIIEKSYVTPGNITQMSLTVLTVLFRPPQSTLSFL